MEKKTRSAPVGGYHTKDIKEATQKAASSCYGVVAIAKRDEILRPDKRLKKGIVEDAVYVKKNPNSTFSVDVYLILSNELKITETLVECQKIIMYQLNKTFTNCCVGVNVYCEKISSSH
ncbi:MAG: Asp23/Gls24 family envelope stress response protein [Bacilli bacterium]|nr:Asp23/Gls24 family envelope stress response protein [Bacilli bacterium]